MSSALIESTSIVDSTTGPGVSASRRNAEGTASPWRWMILACVLLGLSGGWRAWRDYQFAKLNIESKDCPFSLDDLPKSLGAWESVDEAEAKLDPEIAKIAGSTEHIIRTYVESGSGEKVQVLLLYGLAQDVFGHTPEVCYPASGGQSASRPTEKNIDVLPELSKPAHFRSQIYMQHVAPGSDRYTEVFYSFRHGGDWKPDMAGDWKTFRYQPGMFKIQTSRQVSAGAANPNALDPKITDSLVKEIVRAVERRIASSDSTVKKQG